MFAVYAARIDADNPLGGLEAGGRPDPRPKDGWTTVTVKATALNHHDVLSLRGVGLPADRLPMILGCDAAGFDEDGNEVVVYAVVADADAGGGDETLDPRRSLLSERYDGTFAEQVVVHSVVGDPDGADGGGGDETLDPRRSLLSERYDGTFAERVAVPRRNLLPKPAAL